MIRTGREVVDTMGIAALHGLAVQTAARRKPWDQPGHPMPVNKDSARPGRGGRKRLWDFVQAAAHASGLAIPPLPEVDSPDDLLDAAEVAAVRGMPVATFNGLVKAGKLAEPDAAPCGVPHWRRATAAAMRRGPGAGVSRSAAQGRPRSEEAAGIEQLLQDALARVPRSRDGRVNQAALAREAGVSRLTARRFVQRLG